MSREKLEGLLKVTNRAIEIQVIWKRLHFNSVHKEEYVWLIDLVNRSIAGLTDYKLDLKNALKGSGDMSVSEKLSFLLKEIEKTEDPDDLKLYSKKLADITKVFLRESLMEVKNGQN